MHVHFLEKLFQNFLKAGLNDLLATYLYKTFLAAWFRNPVLLGLCFVLLLLYFVCVGGAVFAGNGEAGHSTPFLDSTW